MMVGCMIYGREQYMVTGGAVYGDGGGSVW